MGMVSFRRGSLPLAAIDANGIRSLLELAGDADVDLVRYVCQSGTCGTCLVTLVEGTLEQPEPFPPGIDDWTHDQGGRLACQCVPEAGASLTIDVLPPL